MPIFNPPKQFPMPQAIRGLVESLFPPEPSIPAAGVMMMEPEVNPAVKALGGIQEPHDMATLKRLMEVFRPKDLSNVLPETPSNVPPELGTGRSVSSAFDIYNHKLKSLLGQK